MQFKFIFSILIILCCLTHGFKSKQLVVGKNGFLEGRFSNSHLDEVGYLSLTPTCEKIKQLNEAMIWRVLATPQKTYITTGHSGKLYEISATGEEKVYSSTSGELMALLFFNGDLLIGSGPNGIVYRLKKNALKLQQWSVLPVSFIWDMIIDGNDVLVATGNKGAIYRLGAKGKKQLFFESEENNVLKLALYKEKVFASTSGPGYLYEIQKNGKYRILYDAGGRDINDFTLIRDKIYLVTSGKKELLLNHQKIPANHQANAQIAPQNKSPSENNQFENVLVEVDIKGGFTQLHTIKNQTIPTLMSMGEDKLFLALLKKVKCIAMIY